MPSDDEWFCEGCEPVCASAFFLFSASGFEYMSRAETCFVGSLLAFRSLILHHMEGAR